MYILFEERGGGGGGEPHQTQLLFVTLPQLVYFF